MRVSIVGAGYVGLVTGACLAEQGHDVVCADLDQTRSTGSWPAPRSTSLASRNS